MQIEQTQFLTRMRAKAAPLAVGILVGMLVVSTALTWLLTWGDHIEFVSAACLMAGLGLLSSRSIICGQAWNVTLLAVASCCMALVQPAILLGLTSSLRWIPVEWTELPLLSWGIALASAAPVWFFSAVVWSKAIDAVVSRDFKSAEATAVASFAVCIGMCLGIALNVFALGSFLGIWWPGFICLVVAVGCHWRMIRRENVDSSHEPGVEHLHSESARSEMPVASIVAALTLGGLFSVVTRLIGQLFPNGYQLICVEWIGLFAGVACGIASVRKQGSNSGRSILMCLIAAAWSVLLLAAFPFLVNVSLWMNSTLTWVSALLIARSALLMAAIVPLGAALGSKGHREFEGVAGTAGRIGMPFVCGLVVTNVLFESIGLFWSLGLCSGLLVVMALIEQVRSASVPSTWISRLGGVCLVLLALSFPIWRSHDDPARVAKLLFSTPAFLAHRSGWDSHLLPQLDDTRMVFHSEGSRGPLTLWRSRGLELHLRENGVPRAVISANRDVHPQFAPEVLQAVLPILMSDAPNRVLLLGTSGGVPLATCLHFPVQEAVCIEGDFRMIDMLRGPIAREVGFDSLADDRVKLLSVAPELALMASDSSFDVILSSPSPSSLVAGGASFTREFYQRASGQLASRGIFCQRFECLDYGPQPLRLIVQAMRQAFREVIAVEAGPGEMLLMATNSESVFIPDDLPSRLEVAHVRKLLARSGFDWSTLLNLPTYDHAALGEICDEARSWSNSTSNGLLALKAPLDMMRWGPKLQQTQEVLTAMRSTSAPFWNRQGDEAPNLLSSEAKLSRKSRFLEWLGDSRVSPEVLRRLSEVVTQQKLVREHPESHWWEYRKALRQQLQEHPRSAVQQVKHVRGEKKTHQEDLSRKEYFEALGEAVQRAKPTDDQIAAIEACLEPYDPLLSYFARQEIADLQARGQTNPSRELIHRLHVIYFAPAGEASTRNVVTAIELIVKQPETIPDPARRFDVLNGLVQQLRTRWELRQNTPVITVQRQLTDVNRSVVAVEKALTAMDELASAADLSAEEWATRKQVVDRILLRPLRSYRSSLQAQATKSEGRSRAIIEQAADAKSD